MRPSFDMARACFFLLAAVIVVQIAVTAGGTFACIWMIVAGRGEMGACAGLTDRAREIWSELFAAILALLVAAKGGPPPPEKPPPPPP